MASKPNYNFQRAERDRAKKAKKEEKLQEKRLAAARDASESNAEPAPEAEPAQDEAK